jgi:HEAT repeat protein
VRERPHPLTWARAIALVVAAAAACDQGDRAIERDVALATGALEPAAAAAADRLVRHGRRAIAILETGLYTAEPPGRVRVVQTLVRIGDPDAVPILRLVAERDPDPGVRRAALDGIATLSPP